MMPRLSPAWQRYFAQPVAPAAPPSFRRVPLVAAGAPTPSSRFVPPSSSASATAAYFARPTAGAPPNRPRPPVDRRPTPEPPRRPLELAWLTWQLPERLRADVLLTLRQTLEWRAQHCQPLGAPKKPPEYTRFGLEGERLSPKGVFTVRKTMRAEVREMVRTVEGSQSRTERNRRLAMHSIRLGQLCAELEQRGIDALEELRNRLARLRM